MCRSSWPRDLAIINLKSRSGVSRCGVQLLFEWFIIFPQIVFRAVVGSIFFLGNGTVSELSRLTRPLYPLLGTFFYISPLHKEGVFWLLRLHSDQGHFVASAPYNFVRHFPSVSGILCYFSIFNCLQYRFHCHQIPFLNTRPSIEWLYDPC